MDKLIRVINYPNNLERHGIYKLLYKHNDVTYEAHVSPEEYKVRILKQKFIFEMGYSEKDIEEFEDAIRNMIEEEHIWDDINDN